jgi:asparagine synthase (glutamine-hydrolysing)
MSGIAGIYGNDDPKLVGKVLKRMEHRGERDRKIYEYSGATLGIIKIGNISKKAEYKDSVIIMDGRVLQNIGDGRKIINKDREVLKLYQKYGRKFVNYLNGPFAIAIIEDEQLFVARDPLGLKPLYYIKENKKFIFASEIKSLVPINKEIKIFPPGYYYHTKDGFVKYFSGLTYNNKIFDREEIIGRLRSLLIDTVKRRLTDSKKPGIYLSGGIDSSVLVAAATKNRSDIKTFSVGTEGSEDLDKARIVAEYLETEHYEYKYTQSEMFKIIPKVIYYLESFDQYLVRSSIANYFVGKLARGKDIDLVLCGEGGDELFGGYKYLKNKGKEEIEKELKKLTETGHANGFQRVDRMNMANSLIYDMPFMDKKIWKYAARIPIKWKIYGSKSIEKWILRKAFENDLPYEILWREKSKFFEGTNTTSNIKEFIENKISDEEFEREKKINKIFILRSKEELYYYRIFRRYYPHSSILNTIGRTRTAS